MILIMPRQLLVLRAIGRSVEGLTAFECGAASSADEESEYGPLGQAGYGRFLAEFLVTISLCHFTGERFTVTPEGVAWLAAHPVPKEKR
jgi:hypothetical protein